jgi:hypothetical protein
MTDVHVFFPLFCQTKYNTTTISDQLLFTKHRSEQIKRYCLLAGSTTDIAVQLDSPFYVKNTHQNMYRKYNTKRKRIQYMESTGH